MPGAPAVPTPPLELYWQPGCTSCLRAKEFLRSHGIAYESYDVRADAAALQRLESLGLRTVPVLRRGTNHVFAQDVDEVARFVGVDAARTRLGTGELAARLALLLGAAQTLTLALPPARLETRLPGRERTWIDLAYHVACIVEAFLAATDGSELAYEYYERRAPAGARDAHSTAAKLRLETLRLQAWRARSPHDDATPLRTYFGARPLAAVLERTTWHVAQHCRQLEHLVIDVGGVPIGPVLTPAILAGLPLPQSIWDPEAVPGANG
jgi:glutaredoxin